jgi:hypothetical protein
MLTAGRFEGPQRAMVINPAGQPIEFPVSKFTLEAFNTVLDMDRLQKDIGELVVEINSRLETHINELADTISIDKGVPKDKLMAFGGAGFCTYIRFQSGGKGEK